MTVVHSILYHRLNRRTGPSSNSREAATVTSFPANCDAAPRVLACSAYVSQHLDLLFPSRKLCEDRRGFFEHLSMNSLVKSTIKVTATVGSTTLTNYFSDQLREEIIRDENLKRGKLRPDEAEQEADEWAEREWRLRWAAFPQKLSVSLAKYHAVIIVMRSYEYIASKLFDEVTLDKLTMDTFLSAKRIKKEGKSGGDLARDMFSTCYKANIIAFLADYSVHQAILVFGYYAYVQSQRKRKDGTVTLHSGSVALSLLKRSTLLAFSRVFSLICASAGGAIGSVMWAGWGTIAGLNLGDATAAAFLTDEMMDGTPLV